MFEPRPPDETVSVNNLLLHITNDHPGALYLSVMRQMMAKWDFVTSIDGELVGKMESGDQDHPIIGIETHIRGAKVSTEQEEMSDRPGVWRGVGEKIEEFNLDTRISLHDHTFIDNRIENSLVENLQRSGYQTEKIVSQDKGRSILIYKDGVGLDLSLGFPNQEGLLAVYRHLREYYQKNYPNSVSVVNSWIREIENRKDKSVVTLEVVNAHPQLGPSGIPLESKEQVLKYIKEEKDLVEIIGDSLIKNLGNGKTYPKLEMEWKPTKTVTAVWQEQDSTLNNVDLENIPVADLSSSMVRVIQCLQDEKYTPDLLAKQGLQAEADHFLTAIETYFDQKLNGDNIDEINDLDEKDRVLLALGLVLKSAKTASLDDSHFIPGTGLETAIAGVTFNIYGESRRSRLEFFMQQDRKYAYRRDTSEAADFLLLHTTYQEQSDKLTRYERIQSQNLDKARDWVATVLEPSKKGDYSPKDVQTLNTILLADLVSDRALGLFRTKSDVISGRVGMTKSRDIEYNLSRLSRDVNNYIYEYKNGLYKPDESVWLKDVVNFWACFDAIHPMEEGNGRSGTLLFESWYRLCGGTRKFDSPRWENLRMAQLMGKALKGDEESDYYYTGKVPGDINPLVEYVDSHLKS